MYADGQRSPRALPGGTAFSTSARWSAALSRAAPGRPLANTMTPTCTATQAMAGRAPGIVSRRRHERSGPT
jgi:hypothetical protein